MHARVARPDVHDRARRSASRCARRSIVARSRRDEGVEYCRVREIGWSGLTIALAASFLMVTCRSRTSATSRRTSATSRPRRRVNRPSTSSRRPASRSRSCLFFPDAERGQGPGQGLLRGARRRRPARSTIEEHDRFVDAELAGKYKVTKDGVIVLVNGTGDKEKSQTIEVDTDIEKARKGASKLRNFDREVNSLADEARPREAQGVRDDRPRRDQRSRLGAAGSQGPGARAPHHACSRSGSASSTTRSRTSGSSTSRRTSPTTRPS